jgi:hypothetical protein
MVQLATPEDSTSPDGLLEVSRWEGLVAFKWCHTSKINRDEEFVLKLYIFVKFDCYLKMKYKTLIFYQITWHHISKDDNLSLHILCVT